MMPSGCVRFDAKSTIFGLILIFSILNALDLVLTILAINGGRGIEGNPIMAYLLENSFVAFSAVKIIAGLVIAFILFKLFKKNKKAARITAMLIVVAYIFIVVNNAVVNAEIVTVNKTGTFTAGIAGVGYDSETTGLTSYIGGRPYDAIWLDFSQYPIISQIEFYPWTRYAWKGNSNPTGTDWGIIYVDKNGVSHVVNDVSGAFGTQIELYNGANKLADAMLYVYPLPDYGVGKYKVLIIINTSSYDLNQRVLTGVAEYKIVYPLGDKFKAAGTSSKYYQIGGGTFGIGDSYYNRKINEWQSTKITYYSETVSDYYEYNYVYDGLNEQGWLNVTKTGGASRWIINYASYIGNTTYQVNIDSDLNKNSFNYSFPGYLINATVYYTSTVYDVIDFPQPQFSSSGGSSNSGGSGNNQTGTSTVTFYFLDSETGALIDNVNFTLQESFIGNSTVISGTYDYSVTVNNLNDLEVYTYTATREGYEVATGNVYYPPAGQEIIVYVYLTPIKTPSNANNSIITFRVVSNFRNYQFALVDAAVTLNGETKLTNAQGYVSFEVPKNQTYNYIVSKDGYFSKAGEITATQDYHSIVVQLEPIISATTPTPTPTPATTPTTGGGGGSGSGGSSWNFGQSNANLDRGISLFYENADGLIGLAILVTIMSFLKMMSGGRWR